MSAVPTAGAAADYLQNEGSKGAVGDVEFVFNLPEPALPLDEKQRRRFESLATKRALGTATEAEDAAFFELQKARFSDPAIHSGEEILAAYRRRQMVLEAQLFLQRHVRVIES